MAEHVEEGIVGIGDDAAYRPEIDADDVRFEQTPQACFVAHESVLHALACGDFRGEFRVGLRQFGGAFGNALLEVFIGQAQRGFGLFAQCNLLLQQVVLLRELFTHRAQRQVGAHARQHFFHFKRLGDVVDGACLEACQLVGLLQQRGHEDHRNVTRFLEVLQSAAGFETVDAGHHHVEQDEIGMRAPRPCNCFLAILRHQHLQAAFFKYMGQHAEIGGSVVDHENGLAFGLQCWLPVHAGFLMLVAGQAGAGMALTGSLCSRRRGTR